MSRRNNGMTAEESRIAGDAKRMGVRLVVHATSKSDRVWLLYEAADGGQIGWVKPLSGYYGHGANGIGKAEADLEEAVRKVVKRFREGI